MHEKILRDLREVLDFLEKKDQRSYIEIERDAITLLAKANYRKGQFEYMQNEAKRGGGKVQKGGRGR